MSKNQSQFEFHPHEQHIKQHTFSDGTQWRTCTATIDGKRCRFATGEGRDRKIICHTHTSGDIDNVLPELDDIVVPEYGDDEPEPPITELSMTGWTQSGRAALQVDESNDDADEDRDEEQDDAENEEVEGDDEQ
jgi:hypothetical protein